MNITKALKSVISGVVATSMLLSIASFLPEQTIEADAASLCSVNTNKTYQMVRGFGGMNLPEWIAEGDLTNAQRQTAFGNGANELGLTVLRAYVSDDKNQWKTAVPTAQYAQKMGATVFATPWNPPSSIRENGSGTFQGGKYHVNSSKYGAYAQHLNDYYTYMKGQGVDLYSISVQNEPDYSKEWTGWTSDETTAFLANYGDKLNFRVMSPESFQYTNKDYYNKILNNPKAMANCDLFGTHFYGTQRSQMDFSALESSGKEIWMTEVYVPNSTANSANNWPEAVDVAKNIHNGLVVGNMSVYTWWYIRRSYGLMTDDGKISKRGYCMAQYSKYVRPGDYRIDVTEQPTSNVFVSAYKHSDTQIEIVAVNGGADDYAQQFSVDNRTITNINRYRTTANENIAETKGLDHDTSTFFAQLPKNSVSTFVITLESDGKDVPDGPDTPTQPEPLTPNADGYYFHDTFEKGTCEWEGRGAAEITLSGKAPYKDAEALLVSNRESSWNGTQKTLNALTFEGGKTFSFSACVNYLEGPATQNFLLSLQYTLDGETQYDHIAEGTAIKGNYVQLANPSYTIPAGATSPILYIETDTGTDSFYIDEVIGAVKDTKIDGPMSVKLTPGDVNCDGIINAFDLTALKNGLLVAFTDAAAQLAADVDNSSEVNAEDAAYLQEFLLRKITEFPDNTPELPTMTMAEYTAMVQAMVSEKETDASKQEKGGVTYGTLKNATYFSSTCNRNKPYNILLPANYDTSKKYPVLYVMHGYWENQDRMIIKGNNTMSTRQIIGNAIAEGAAEDMIVVFPYIYSSATQPDCTAMDEPNNIAYDNFINDLTKDLMPHIEKTYSVKTGRDNTAITGFSMGGRESLLIGMKRPDLFGYIGAICPAPGVTGSFNWASETEAPHLLFITAGSNDTVVYDNPKTYHDNFTKNNVPHIWHYVNGGYHGDNSIHAHLFNFVRGIFKTK